MNRRELFLSAAGAAVAAAMPEARATGLVRASDSMPLAVAEQRIPHANGWWHVIKYEGDFALSYWTKDGVNVTGMQFETRGRVRNARGIAQAMADEELRRLRDHFPKSGPMNCAG